MQYWLPSLQFTHLMPVPVVGNADLAYYGCCSNHAFVCIFLSDFYWYIDHSCEEYKTSSVPAPDLPSVPCGGSVQPEHRWQRYYAGNTVRSGKDCRAISKSKRWPSRTGHIAFKALLTNSDIGSCSGVSATSSLSWKYHCLRACNAFYLPFLDLEDWSE